MALAACSEERFIELLQTKGPSGTAKELKISYRCVLSRRERIEAARGIKLKFRDMRVLAHSDYPWRLIGDIEDGCIIVGSDAHYWPGYASTAHRAMVGLIKALKPEYIVMNGDVLDGARISRHPPIGWARTPSVREEKETVEERLAELKAACPEAKRIWTLGNHDMRFENRLAKDVGEFEGIGGFALQDHFPDWQQCLSFWVNDSVVIKHRHKNGVHATHNNTLWAGKTMVTGHLHSLKATPFSDYNGVRYGVDTGTLDDPYGPQFLYAEDNPLNHRSGFAVLTFHKGEMLQPELCMVMDKERVQFRGDVFKV